jgi:hypothetical protein
MIVKPFVQSNTGELYPVRYDYERIYHLRRNGEQHRHTLCGIGDYMAMLVDDTGDKPLCSECGRWMVVRMME